MGMQLEAYRGLTEAPAPRSARRRLTKRRAFVLAGWRRLPTLETEPNRSDRRRLAAR